MTTIYRCTIVQVVGDLKEVTNLDTANLAELDPTTRVDQDGVRWERYGFSDEKSAEFRSSTIISRTRDTYEEEDE
jgi:hypothetical protein